MLLRPPVVHCQSRALLGLDRLTCQHPVAANRPCSLQHQFWLFRLQRDGRLKPEESCRQTDRGAGLHCVWRQHLNIVSYLRCFEWALTRCGPCRGCSARRWAGSPHARTQPAHVQCRALTAGCTTKKGVVDALAQCQTPRASGTTAGSASAPGLQCHCFKLSEYSAEVTDTREIGHCRSPYNFVKADPAVLRCSPCPT